ncbi:MAG TPA: WYL domain-containing protein [Actinomycetota bacterium]|nr:WYL domain-containing protein [Actinomycetota bacterium]
MRRIERLINLIAALLDTPRPMTAEEIRERIAGYDQPTHEAFRRAFERDKDSLRSMGIPIELRSTGAAGDLPDGYIIPKEKYYLPDLDLLPDELAALKLAAEAVLGGAGLAESGLMKLSIDAPSVEWSGPRVVWGTDVAAEQPVLGPLYSAVLDRTPIEFSYETADGASSRRVLEPYGLVHRGGHWYIVGRDAERDALRSFKVSRIRGRPTTLEGTYEIPEGFDPAERFAGEAWAIGDSDATAVTVRFDPSVRWWAEQNLDRDRTRDGPTGALDVDVDVVNEDAFISWLLGFGADVEVVAPDELRARVRDHLAPFTS